MKGITKKKNGCIGGKGQSHPPTYSTLTLLHATCHEPHSEFTEGEPLRESYKDPLICCHILGEAFPSHLT